MNTANTNKAYGNGSSLSRVAINTQKYGVQNTLVVSKAVIYRLRIRNTEYACGINGISYNLYEYETEQIELLYGTAVYVHIPLPRNPSIGAAWQHLQTSLQALSQ